ncbi:MAG: TIGR01777 family oxidoreductase [bacterium]
MKVAITGATGFIGSRLCKALLEQGAEINVLSRNADHAKKSLPGITNAFDWNAEAEKAPTEALAGMDAVIHLAGANVGERWTKEQKNKILESRRQSTQNLVAGLADTHPRPPVLISASAIGYYGDRGDEVLSEESMPGEGFLSRVCIIWEDEAFLAERLGMRVVALRTGLVLDKEGGTLKSMLLPFKLGFGGPLGSGTQWMSWIHMDDMIGLYEFALTNSQVRGPMNATAPNPVRNKEFAHELGKVLRRPSLLPVPKFALKALLGEFAEAVLTGQRVEPQKALKTGYQFIYPNLEPALEAELGKKQ